MINTACSQCDTPLSNLDANLATGLLQCPHCGHKQPLLETVMGLEDKAHKGGVQQMKGVEIKDENTLSLKLSPNLTGYGLKYLIFGVVLLLVNGGLIFYLWPAQDLSNPMTRPIGLVISTGLLLVGIAALFTGIKRLIQHTHIQVDEERLRVRYKWFGWLPVGRRTLAIGEIYQVFVTQFDESKGNRSFVYAVKAQLRSGKIRTLIRRLGKAEYAFFIERKLEAYLNIEDKILTQEYIPSHMGATPASEKKARPTSNPMIQRNQFPDMGDLLEKLQEREQREKQEQDLPKPKLKGTQLQPPIYMDCEACGETLADALVNAKDNLIQCKHCKNIEVLGTLQFSDKNAKAWLQSIKSSSQARGVVVQQGLGLTLIVKPPFFEKKNIFWSTVVVIIILAGLGGGFLLSWHQAGDPNGWLYLVMGLTLAGLLVALAGSLTHRIIIQVQGAQLKYYHRAFGGLYVSSEKVLGRHEVDQFFVQKNRYHYRDSGYFYSLEAKLKNGKQHRIIRALSSVEQGYFLEHKIEAQMGIEEQYINKEYAPPLFAPPKQREAFNMNKTFFE